MEHVWNMGISPPVPHSINNNQTGIYNVYVDTKGNEQIRDCRLDAKTMRG